MPLGSEALLRARLHGEFQPGLKFQPAQSGWNFVAITWRTSARAEIFLLAAAILFPGKQNHSACPSSLSIPGWNSVSITWDFFRFSGPFARAENPSPVWANRARIFSPGWIAPRMIQVVDRPNTTPIGQDKKTVTFKALLLRVRFSKISLFCMKVGEGLYRSL